MREIAADVFTDPIENRPSHRAAKQARTHGRPFFHRTDRTTSRPSQLPHPTAERSVSWSDSMASKSIHLTMYGTSATHFSQFSLHASPDA